MKLEILLGFLQSLSCTAGVLLVVYICTWAIVGIMCLADGSSKKAKILISKTWLVGSLILLIANIPSVNDIWKIRIGLIKLELSSPENISKASDEIERIGHKLECRYLGCNDKESSK